MANKPEIFKPGPKYVTVKLWFDKDLAKYNYQLLLQHLSSVVVTKDNVNDDLTKDGREVLKSLVEMKDSQSEEPLQWHRDIMEVYNGLKNPLEEQMKRISLEKKVVAYQVEQETAKQFAEQSRIANAKAAIQTFNNRVANMISVAKTDADIVAIEKLIGSEKTKTTVYQEFLPELVLHCDGLRPQVKDLKEKIRKLKKIEEDEKSAMDMGDHIRMVGLMEEKEKLQQVISETGLRIHEQAYEQATTIEVVAPEVSDVVPKGRTNWKWRVDDIGMLRRKMPHLVKIVPDDDKINSVLATMKLEGKLTGKMEEKWNGITFFNDKSYSR